MVPPQAYWTRETPSSPFSNRGRNSFSKALKEDKSETNFRWTNIVFLSKCSDRFFTSVHFASWTGCSHSHSGWDTATPPSTR